MIAVIVEFDVKPEHRAEFLARLRQDAAQTLLDDGCLRMEVLVPCGNGNHLMLSELWRDDAAIAAHRNRPGHSHAWQERLIVGKRVTSAELLSSTG